MIDELVENLPASPKNRPVSKWSAAELLADNARLGLLRLREIIDRPITDVIEPRRERLIGEMSLGVTKVYRDVQVAALQAARDGGWEKLQAAVAEHRKKYGGGKKEG